MLELEYFNNRIMHVLALPYMNVQMLFALS